MNDSERLAAVKACRWADLVLPEVPYVMNEEYINYLFEHHNVDYVVHGDDPCIVDGKDVYATAKQAGKYKSIPRTEGISTTDVVGRILMLAEEQPPPPSACEFESHEHISSYSNFLTTTHKLRQFTDNVKAPHEGSTVVYIPGCWDMYHSGHVAMLEKAREFGDYVIVGVYNDHLVHNLCNEKDATAGSYPILSMSERTLSVAGCRHTDDVLMDAPYMITEDMLNGMHISVVLVNKKAEMTIAQTENQKHLAVAKQNGKLKVIDFRKHDSLSGAKVANRILAQHDRFMKK
jgi:ethanolamine-phosphate cytidylyltransferase